MEDEERLERDVVDPLTELSGTSLRAYLVLLRSRRPLGVRELQRILGVRSPSTARHHLDRLIRLGLVVEKEGGYVAVPPRRGLLKAYIVLHGALVPRSLVLTAFLLASTAAYVLLPGRDPVAATVLIIASLLSTYHTLEAYKALKQLLEPSRE
ncbi:hypothetical protein PYJP_20410 [Pyrofollis japonicus]|uniref:ArsR family transcriptional regulator n=1 Tax=Pyrofollis japonicus TaxID=3060460 RepID=UPI00295B3FDA|nr:ArsR family transcriptional regulator [Pyrofollis japonicus]BEP18689.1 hypothetical protein PYJP_20410 [Pyrofollis japonicus]